MTEKELRKLLKIIKNNNPKRTKTQNLFIKDGVAIASNTFIAVSQKTDFQDGFITLKDLEYFVKNYDKIKNNPPIGKLDDEKRNLIDSILKLGLSSGGGVSLTPIFLNSYQLKLVSMFFENERIEIINTDSDRITIISLESKKSALIMKVKY